MSIGHKIVDSEAVTLCKRKTLERKRETVAGEAVEVGGHVDGGYSKTVPAYSASAHNKAADV